MRRAIKRLSIGAAFTLYLAVALFLATTFWSCAEGQTPTPTPLPPGCCQFNNLNLGMVPLSCVDWALTGLNISADVCATIIADNPTPGPGTPTPSLIYFNPADTCTEGLCPAPPGCCQLENFDVGMLTVECIDYPLIGSEVSGAVCATIAAGNVPGPGTPTPFAVYYNPDAKCSAGQCAVISAPTPTPTNPIGCCQLGNFELGAVPVECVDWPLSGTPVSVDVCATVVANMAPPPGPGTPTPFLEYYNPDADCSAGQCPAVVGTSTATRTATPTVTETAIPPTIGDTSGLCVATGDKVFPSSALVLPTSLYELVRIEVVVPAAADPWFFLSNAVLFNQGAHNARVTLTMSEVGGLIPPQTIVIDLPSAKTATYQLPFQTWNITPGTYTLKLEAAADSSGVVVVQPTSYIGAWRLGSSAAGCPNGMGGAGSGATICLDNQVNTTPSQPYVETADVLEAGWNVEICLAETLAAVTGGYTVGTAGATDVFGTASGLEDNSTRLSTGMSDALHLIGSAPVRITSAHPSGLFPSTSGIVHVVCYCNDFQFLTPTPTL